MNHLTEQYTHLLTVLEAPMLEVAGAGGAASHVRSFIQHLQTDLGTLQQRAATDTASALWETLTEIQNQTRQLMTEAQGLLGGLVIRQSGLDGGWADSTALYLQAFSLQVGEEWSPTVIIGGDGAHDWPEALLARSDGATRLLDSIVQLPVPRWDIWQMPLVLHELGYWIARWGQRALFDQFVEQEVARINQITAHPPPPRAQFANHLPEIQRLWDIRSQSTSSEAFQEQYGSLMDRLAQRQRLHLWHLVADAMATWLGGPAYAYALLFLDLDPANPFAEGSMSGPAGAPRSRYLPADARRMALVWHTLQAMDAQAKEGAFGPLHAELAALEAIWEAGLANHHHLERFRQMATAMAPWNEAILAGLARHFGGEGAQTTLRWQTAIKELMPYFQNGADAPIKPLPDLAPLVDAAWWCRARYPNRCAQLSLDASLLCRGEHPPEGLGADPAEVMDPLPRLLHSRLYDLHTDLARFEALFRSESLHPPDREAVAGRFFRLLSEQDYILNRQEGFIRRREPAATVLEAVLKTATGSGMRALREEILDLLGGVFLRYEELDRGASTRAEALLTDYAALTGVSWSSRAILGENPIFSLDTDLVHLGFADWDIWHLPLMAHEFGHVTAFRTPRVLYKIEHESLIGVHRGHPQAHGWRAQDRETYQHRRKYHHHEFFADMFATYIQGPAFVYDVVLNHFNPSQATQPRGRHPTYAERVEVILKTLEAMNDSEKTGPYGPYEADLRRVRKWWEQSLEACEVEITATNQFELAKAGVFCELIFTYLETYFRLGAKFEARDWQRLDRLAQTPSREWPNLSGESRRRLLNFAWAVRIRQPDEASEAARRVREAFLLAAQPIAGLAHKNP